MAPSAFVRRSAATVVVVLISGFSFVALYTWFRSRRQDGNSGSQSELDEEESNSKTEESDDETTTEKKRVLVIGLDKAGKSTFVSAISGHEILNERPTEGFSVVSTCIGETSLDLWEIGGSAPLREHWDKYTDDIDVLVYIIDAADTSRIPTAKEVLFNLVRDSMHLQSIPWLLIANKQDLSGAMSPDELRKLLNIPEQPENPPRIVIGMELPIKGLKKGISKAKDFITHHNI